MVLVTVCVTKVKSLRLLLELVLYKLKSGIDPFQQFPGEVIGFLAFGVAGGFRLLPGFKIGVVIC